MPSLPRRLGGLGVSRCPDHPRLAMIAELATIAYLRRSPQERFMFGIFCSIDSMKVVSKKRSGNYRLLLLASDPLWDQVAKRSRRGFSLSPFVLPFVLPFWSISPSSDLLNQLHAWSLRKVEVLAIACRSPDRSCAVAPPAVLRKAGPRAVWLFSAARRSRIPSLCARAGQAVF